MISTPQYDVVADAHSILQHVVLHNEAVLSDLYIAPDKRFRTDIGSELISFPFGFLIKPGADAIELGIRDGGKRLIVARRIMPLDFFEIYDRTTEHLRLFSVRVLDRKRDNLRRRVIREILVS